ncbi:MAG: glycosyltransferase family 4 protein [Patescibacteria group bacterium]|nr:glycosyltransferase family 4 protein [Patescibacteria group bacterium]
MKIAYIASSIIPSRTANSVHVMKMCQAFANNGHEVDLLIPNKADKSILNVEDVYDFYGVKKCFNISRIPLLKTKIGFFVYTFWAVLKARKNNPDLVYTRFLYPVFFSLLFGLPTIYEIHAPFERLAEKIFFCLINKKKLEKIIVISIPLRDYFVDKYKINKDKIFVAPDGADSVESGVGFKKIRENESEMTVGYIGNLYKGRGMEVISRIAERCPRVQFHIVGGSPEDLEYWKSRLSDFENIILHGYVPHRDVNKYMLSFDVLIAPYQQKVTIQGRGDTCQWMSPLKIFEYMAVGKAILSSDLPVLKEVLRHGKNSLLASPEDIDGWVSNLELIRKDTELRKELGKNAKKDFENSYTWKARANNILSNLYYEKNNQL